MIKHTVTYKNFDKVLKTRVVYFHMGFDDATSNLNLVDEIEAIGEFSKGENRELTTEEKTRILEFIKRLAEITYGEKSPDGETFIKTPEVWNKFRYSAAWDAWLFDLFLDNEKVNDFMENLVPEELMERVRALSEKQAQQEGKPVETTPELPTAPPVLEDPDKPAWANYTVDQLLEMSQEDFERVVGRDPKKMPHELLVIAMQRRNALTSE